MNQLIIDLYFFFNFCHTIYLLEFKSLLFVQIAPLNITQAIIRNERSNGIRNRTNRFNESNRNAWKSWQFQFMLVHIVIFKLMLELRVI